MTTIELKEKLEGNLKPFVLDIRESYERAICAIDSVHIPMGEIANRVNELPKDQELVILCKSGNRAQAVANFLEKDFSFDNVFVLEGGIMNWIDTIDTHLEKY